MRIRRNWQQKALTLSELLSVMSKAIVGQLPVLSNDGNGQGDQGGQGEVAFSTELTEVSKSAQNSNSSCKIDCATVPPDNHLLWPSPRLFVVLLPVETGAAERAHVFPVVHKPEEIASVTVVN
jgi:hypothetical protein